MKARTSFKVWVVAIATACTLSVSVRSADSILEIELHPPAPTEYELRKAQREMAAHQQSNRFKIKIPQAVKADVDVAPSAVPLDPGLPPPKPSIFEGREDHVRMALAILLVGALAVRTLVRHKREAEIRALCGGYLSDGTEVARYKLPEWFTPATAKEVAAAAFFGSNDDASDSKRLLPEPLVRFFAEAPEQLSQMREMLRALNGDGTAAERQANLSRLHELLNSLRTKANCWHLRPAWQLSSALELLVKRVADKPTDATASVMRTIAAGVDLLHEICVEGIRPDLIIEPPVKILAVDDDALCRRAIQVALQKANLTPDMAQNGEAAVALARDHTYDVVFMDVQMPGIDGLDACSQIHQINRNREVPVVFVTGQSDFNTRAQSRLKGGSDLMAKPFLVFELTVKAVMYAMRRRLQLSSVHRETAASPAVSVMPGTAAKAPEFPVTVSVSTASLADPVVFKGSHAAAELNGEFHTSAPAFVAVTRKLAEELRVQQPEQLELQEKIGNLRLRVNAVAGKAAVAELKIAARLASTVESLLDRLHKHPKLVTASALNTVVNALALLERLCTRGAEAKLTDKSPVKLLVVEDEPLARRAVVGALQLAFERPDSAEDGGVAATFTREKVYDVIFTDIQMPVKDGFALCAELRRGGINRSTPVVFITSHTDIEARNQALASGGCDFIGKPFLPIEITVKAMTLAWESRLAKSEAAKRPDRPSGSVKTPEPAVAAA